MSLILFSKKSTRKKGLIFRKKRIEIKNKELTIALIFPFLKLDL